MAKAVVVPTQYELFLGPTSSKIINAFTSFASRHENISTAISTLLEREKNLKVRYMFETDLDQTEWTLPLSKDDLSDNIDSVIQTLDDFAIRSRLDSRAAAIEELLFSRDLQNANKLPKEKVIINCTSYNMLRSRRKINKKSVNHIAKKTTIEVVDSAWREYETTKLKMYQCVKCNAISATKELYMEHINQHKETSPPCFYCGNYFPSMSKYEQHIGNLTNEPIYSCVKSDCSCKFVSWCRIACHERLHEGKPEFVCNVCNGGFSTARKCFIHVKHEHLHDFPYKCNECSKGFSNKSLLAAHNKVHAAPKIFKCPKCPRTFTSKPGLRYHSMMHTKLRPHKCQICEKSFKNKSDMKNHERIHSGERPYTCEVCGKSFVENPALRKHRVVHTGEKNYICSKCGKQFGYKSSLTSHAQKCGIETSIRNVDVVETINSVQDLFDYPLLTSKEPSTSRNLYVNFDPIQVSNVIDQDVLNLFDDRFARGDKSVFSPLGLNL